MCSYQLCRGGCAGGRFEKGRSGNPSGRRFGSRNKGTLAAATLLSGKAEALTRKAVELVLAGDPTAMRLCIERLLPPCPRTHRQVHIAADRERQRYLCRDAGGYRGARQGRYHGGRGGNDRGSGRNLCRGDRNNQEASVCCRSAADLALGDYDETGGYDDDNELTGIMSLRIAFRKIRGRPSGCYGLSGIRRRGMAYPGVPRPSPATGVGLGLQLIRVALLQTCCRLLGEPKSMQLMIVACDDSVPSRRAWEPGPQRSPSVGGAAIQVDRANQLRLART
jgi:hypothetical protein